VLRHRFKENRGVALMRAAEQEANLIVDVIVAVRIIRPWFGTLLRHSRLRHVELQNRRSEADIAAGSFVCK
jgi:hypothetical protein